MRRAVGAVFARPEYHWVPRRHPLQWLGHWLHTSLAWLNRMDEKFVEVSRKTASAHVEELTAFKQKLFTEWSF